MAIMLRSNSPNDKMSVTRTDVSFVVKLVTGLVNVHLVVILVAVPDTIIDLVVILAAIPVLVPVLALDRDHALVHIPAPVRVLQCVRLIVVILGVIAIITGHLLSLFLLLRVVQRHLLVLLNVLQSVLVVRLHVLHPATVQHPDLDLLPALVVALVK